MGRLLILFIVAVTLQAAEPVNSQYVLDACTKATKGKVKRGDAMEVGWCLGTVEAVRRTVELLDLRDKLTFGAGIGNRAPIPCAPDGVTAGQLARVVVKYLEDHPEELHKNPLMNILNALIAGFPCSSQP